MAQHFPRPGRSASIGATAPTTLVQLLWRGHARANGSIIVRDLCLTLIRVLAAIGLSTLIAVPIGVWIGSNPQLARYLMPLTQIAASFPVAAGFPQSSSR